ncbi:MAG: hypothetical protein HYR55_02465 [Acidobacteria bacterium]|nr:hypothetical protein [Acidobacteriota bacterium]MBI3658276.1 hypothetical protein [Acidobacteriota bacterium]
MTIRISVLLVVLGLMSVRSLPATPQDPTDRMKEPETRTGVTEDELVRQSQPKMGERSGGGPYENGKYSDRDWRMVSSVHGFDHGYIDGFEQGRLDRIAKRGFDPFLYAVYREALRGFDDRFQFKIAFQQGYRKGFERGFSDAYNNRESLIATRFFEIEQIGERADERDRPDNPDLAERQSAPRAGSTSRRSTLREGTPIRTRIDQALSTKTALRGDRFTAKVILPVVGNDNLVVIPSGSTVRGTVGTVQRPGRIMGRAELNLRFESVVLPDGTEESLVATLTNLDRTGGKARIADGEGTVHGEKSVGRDTAVIAGASGIGAAIGAIAGGGKGVAIGAGTGGLIALAGVLATRGKDIELPSGTEIEIQLERPLTLPVAREAQ